MILIYLILVPVIAGILSWLAGRLYQWMPRIISALSLVLCLILVILRLVSGELNDSHWTAEYSLSWIPQVGIGVHLAVDGLSVLLLLLTFFIGLIAVLLTRESKQPGFLFFNILLCIAGIEGVFMSADLFLFYFFWELMIVPIYFIISIWGDSNRMKAANKFFIYTQAGGLLMLLSIASLYFIHGNSTGIYTFDLKALKETPVSLSLQLLLMGGFLAAFLVKLPAFILHTWLPDAYTEAPLAGTIILACLMSKTAVYGLLRYTLPLFPEASVVFAPYGMALGVIGILYGAKLAYAQSDLKKLIAYTSMSHMGFMLPGIYAFNQIAYQGVVIQMIAHSLSTCAIFIISDQLYIRLNTRNLNNMGGLWNEIPSMGAMGLFFSMALLGLPGLGNFIGEFLILGGAFRTSILFTSIASAGLIFSTVYALKIMQKAFFGEPYGERHLKDLSAGESLITGIFVIAVLFIGLFPQPVINMADSAIENIAIWIK